MSVGSQSTQRLSTVANVFLGSTVSSSRTDTKVTKVILTVLLSIVRRLRYDVMAVVQQVTVLRCGQGKTLAQHVNETPLFMSPKQRQKRTISKGFIQKHISNISVSSCLLYCVQYQQMVASFKKEKNIKNNNQHNCHLSTRRVSHRRGFDHSYATEKLATQWGMSRIIQLPRLELKTCKYLGEQCQG